MSFQHSILIVDDEEDLRNAIAFDFNRRNYHVVTADSGNNAFAILEKQAIDVVLTDVRMANGDGLELLRKIKAKNSILPVVIFITAYADISLDEAYDLGADAIFSKPYEREALFAAVERVCQPPGKRWQRNTSRIESIETNAGLYFKKSNFSADGTVSNLGRGGFFTALQGRMPSVGEEVIISLQFDNPKKIKINGSGIVRWRREEELNNLPAGCGVEFESIQEDSRLQLLEMVNFFKTKSFIPRK